MHQRGIQLKDQIASVDRKKWLKSGRGGVQIVAVLERILERTSRIMHVLSGIVLAAIVLLPCFDVIMRRSGASVDFPFEVVCALVGGVVIALALPKTTLMKTHVIVEYLETKLGPVRFRPVYRLTRCCKLPRGSLEPQEKTRLGTIQTD
jgi:hypothetical protein